MSEVNLHIVVEQTLVRPAAPRFFLRCKVEAAHQTTKLVLRYHTSFLLGQLLNPLLNLSDVPLSRSFVVVWRQALNDIVGKVGYLDAFVRSKQETQVTEDLQATMKREQLRLCWWSVWLWTLECPL